MKIVFISYSSQLTYKDPLLWIEKISNFSALMNALVPYCSIAYIKQTGYEGIIQKNNVDYIFLRSINKKPRFPWRLNKALKKLRPDIVIVSGIRSPLQVMLTKLQLGKKVRLIGKHHAESPPTGFRKILQRFADRCFDAYLFTSKGNAAEWIKSGIIKNENKLFEFSGSSTAFKKMNKKDALQKTGMNGSTNFLWVGGLNENKDPLTVLEGFEKYLASQAGSKFYMIFHTADMIDTVQKKIDESKSLKNAVVLQGYVPYNEMPAWYSAANFFISGSHSEGGSFALAEAMACGCIPIITKIPAALKMTGDGKYAISFRAGNADDLADKLMGLSSISKTFADEVEKYFSDHLSADSMARQLYEYCISLLQKKSK
ncbi:MAG: glycosyltransferase family 4 protein [Ferruginibacter sp.]